MPDTVNLSIYLKSLQSFLLSDTDVALLQRNRTKAVVKEIETFGWINTKERGHILVVGKSGRQSNQPDNFLGCLYLTNSSSNN